MVNLLLVGLGGFCGAAARYAAGLWVAAVDPAGKFPSATLAVNLAGCLLIGIAFGLVGREALGRPVQLLLVTGFLGGFTTFSTFGLDTVKLVQTGAYGGALAYVAASVAGGLALVVAGYALAK